MLANTNNSRAPRARGGGDPSALITEEIVEPASPSPGTSEPVPEPDVAASTARVTPWRMVARRGWAMLRREAVWVPLVVFLLSRVYVFLLGALAMHINLPGPHVEALQYRMPELPGLAHYLLQPWRNWDGHWYAIAVLRGYRYHEAVTAFFPLYPMLLYAGNWLLDGRIELAGVLISNVALLGALFLLYRLIAIDYPRPVVRRTLLYLALFPTAYYFSAVYSESLFLFLAVGCLLAARRDHWWLAGICGFFAALTRSHGILLALPLAIMFLQQQGWHPLRWKRNPMFIALVPAGLLTYFAYLSRLWQDPLITLQAQKGWDRYTANPIQALQAGWDAANGCAARDWNVGIDFCWAEQTPTIATMRGFFWRWALAESNVIELVATIFMIVVAIIAFRYLPLAYSTFLAAGIILPLWSPSAVHPLMSMHRFALALFPLFLMLALIGKWRPFNVAWMIVSTVLLAFLTIQFASWLWVA